MNKFIILKTIFNYLLMDNNIFNISIKDYKEYHELLSSIELEITTNGNNYGKFNNILTKKIKDIIIYILIIIISNKYKNMN